LEQIKIQNESSNFNLNNVEFEANVNIVNNTSIILDKEDSSDYDRNDLSSEVRSHVTIQILKRCKQVIVNLIKVLNKF